MPPFKVAIKKVSSIWSSERVLELTWTSKFRTISTKAALSWVSANRMPKRKDRFYTFISSFAYMGIELPTWTYTRSIAKWKIYPLIPELFYTTVNLKESLWLKFLWILIILRIVVQCFHRNNDHISGIHSQSNSILVHKVVGFSYQFSWSYLWWKQTQSFWKILYVVIY